VANLVKSFLSQKDLDAVADAITETERRTSGEIRVAIRQKRAKNERGVSLEQLARLEFARLGMIKTAERTGVLLFILVEERKFYILADEHINERVAPKTWEGIAEAMAQRFAKSEYRDGLLTAVASVGEHLASHFPVRKDDKNELPNNVALS
jgi:uncharacterized membrane protein